MSTFLQMVNTVRQEAGLNSGGDLTTLQTGLSAESTRVTNWVNREWQAIQRLRPDWQWMRQTAEFVTATDVPNYSVAAIGAIATGPGPSYTPATFTTSQFGNWKRDSFRIYTHGSNYADEMLSAFMPWDMYRNVYLYNAMRTTYSRPVAFSVAPDKSLWFGIIPDNTGWQVVFEYYTAPVALVNDTDVPSMPVFYHDLIVFRALKAYGIYMAATEVVERAEDQINEILPKLLGDQLPIIVSGPPLA